MWSLHDRRYDQPWLSAATSLVVVLMTLGVASCDGFLDVELPGEIEARELDNPQMAQLLVRSAQGDFECAYSRYVRQSGLLTGELLGSLLSLINVPYLERRVESHHTGFGESTCETSASLYTPLSTARFSADDALERLARFSDADVPDRAALQARAALYAGYSYAVFGEGFCRAAFDGGPAASPAETLRLARDRFTQAIEFAAQAGDTEVLYAAHVGRARVRMSLGEVHEAAEDARMVPAGFAFYVTRSDADARRRNAVYEDNYRSEIIIVGPRYWDVRWQGVSDPRVSVTDAGRLAGGDNQTPLWYQTKYTAPSSPIRLASHEEAQLIIAEVEGGQSALDIINAFHEAADIPPFESSDADEILHHVIDERRRELYLEGHRMGDLRRFGGFAEWAEHGQNHPFQGLTFGNTDCFPLPDVEIANNPNL